MDTPFPNLSEAQKEQIKMQRDKHQHNRMVFDFNITAHGDVLKNFVVHPGVWNPSLVVSRYCASYLYYNNARLYESKDALDMGCGTGLLGIVMATYGAKRVVCSDTSEPAVNNTKENLDTFRLSQKTSVTQGYLFEKVEKKFDLIVFNHPFFADAPPQGDTIAASMLNSGELIQQFLTEAPNYMNPDARILMPFFSLAGNKNHPVAQGKKYGFKVETTFSTECNTGLQKGLITVHEMVRL